MTAVELPAPAVPLSLRQPRVRASVDLGAVRRNVVAIRRMVGAATQMWPVVKADAYGHGATRVARAIEALCDGLAVAHFEEGLLLRGAGLRCPILVLASRYERCAGDPLALDLTPVVHDLADLAALDEAARRRGEVARVHVEIDTGMCRLGISTARLPDFLQGARRFRRIQFVGACTHFACADSPDREATDDALTRFHDALRLLRRHLPTARLLRHAAASAAVLRFPETWLDAVRPGLAIYGVSPLSDDGSSPLHPALVLSSEVIQLRAPDLSEAGRDGRPRRVALIAAGFGDGYPRRAATRAFVLIRGRRAKVLHVGIDTLVADVTDVDNVALGDVVTLIGVDGQDRIGAEGLAAATGTVAHAVLVGINGRVLRAYGDHDGR